MNPNSSGKNLRWLTPSLRRSLPLCLLIALMTGMWSAHLVGKNSLGANDKSAASGEAQPPRRFPLTATDRARMAPLNAQAAKSSRATTQAQIAKTSTKRDGEVKLASHEVNGGPAPADFDFPPDASAGQNVPLPPSVMTLPHSAVSGQSVVIPADRLAAPTIKGNHLKLRPGETATERSLRLMNVIAEQDQHNTELAAQNARLQAQLKTKEIELQKALDQIIAARKTLQLDQEEFQRLRKELNDLREKFRAAERENVSIMRSISPLLKQMLHSEDEPSAKD